MASTSWAFFIEPAPLIPRPPAIALRSASSRELSPPDFFFDAGASVEVGSMVSVT
jgi:hypothetical protein